MNVKGTNPWGWDMEASIWQRRHTLVGDKSRSTSVIFSVA